MRRWVEHMAELELEIEEATETGVFAEALSALSELLRGESRGEAEQLEIALEGNDRAALLAEWLEELVYLADVRGFVPEELIEIDLDGEGLHTLVGGYRGEPRPLVKAITRHRLEFRPGEAGWLARVVLDV